MFICRRECEPVSMWTEVVTELLDFRKMLTQNMGRVRPHRHRLRLYSLPSRNFYCQNDIVILSAITYITTTATKAIFNFTTCTQDNLGNVAYKYLLTA